MDTRAKVNDLESKFGCGTHFCDAHKTIDHRYAQISPTDTPSTMYHNYMSKSWQGHRRSLKVRFPKLLFCTLYILCYSSLWLKTSKYQSSWKIYVKEKLFEADGGDSFSFFLSKWLMKPCLRLSDGAWPTKIRWKVTRSNRLNNRTRALKKVLNFVSTCTTLAMTLHLYSKVMSRSRNMTSTPAGWPEGAYCMCVRPY